MKRFTLLALILSFSFIGTACVRPVAPVVPPVGSFYSDFKSPLDITYDRTDLGDKIGEATSKNVLGLFAWGDASIQAAAKQGGVRTIKHADYKFWTLLSIYSEFTTVVYGTGEALKKK